jgi:hypothetical protein
MSAAPVECNGCDNSARYVNIGYDLEFSGSRLDQHFVVSWASVAEDAVTHQVLSSKKVLFHRPDNRSWDQRCVDEFWCKPAKDGESEEQKKNREALVAEYKSVESRDSCRKTAVQGTVEMIEWINSVLMEFAGADDRNIAFLCDTCGPDYMWMNYYLAFWGSHEPLHTFFGGKFKDCICNSCYALGAAGCSTVEVCKVVKEKGHFSEGKAIRQALWIPDCEQPTAPHDSVVQSRKNRSARLSRSASTGLRLEPISRSFTLFHSNSLCECYQYVTPDRPCTEPASYIQAEGCRPAVV